MSYARVTKKFARIERESIWTDFSFGLRKIRWIIFLYDTARGKRTPIKTEKSRFRPRLSLYLRNDVISCTLRNFPLNYVPIRDQTL